MQRLKEQIGSYYGFRVLESNALCQYVKALSGAHSWPASKENNVPLAFPP